MYSSNGGGAQTTVMVGDYEPLNMTVWYNPDSLVNILSLREVRVKHKVTMNTDIYPSMAVHERGGEEKIYVFEECKIGLYSHDTENPIININHVSDGYTFLSTVDGNKEGLQIGRLIGHTRPSPYTASLEGLPRRSSIRY